VTFNKISNFSHQQILLHSKLNPDPPRLKSIYQKMLSHCVTCEKPGEEVPEGGEVCGRMRPAHQQHQALAHRGAIYTPKFVLIPGGYKRDVVYLG
jgi:hypothetical protein